MLYENTARKYDHTMIYAKSSVQISDYTLLADRHSIFGKSTRKYAIAGTLSNVINNVMFTNSRSRLDTEFIKRQVETIKNAERHFFYRQPDWTNLQASI